MGCGCNKKKKPTQVQESVDYQTNGGGTVRLGLSANIHLPVKMPNAIDGRDVIILANKRQQVPRLDAPVGSKPALVIKGRNAFVEAAHKEQMMAKWPKAFHVA